MKKEAVVFAIVFLIVIWISDALRLPYQDEIWLAAGIVAALVAYWFRPDYREGYIEFTAPITLLLLVGYIIVLKAPKLLLSQWNYPYVRLLLLLIYVSTCWLAIKRRQASRNQSRRT